MRHSVCAVLACSSQGLAPLVDILEVEKCIVRRGGNINYKVRVGSLLLRQSIFIALRCRSVALCAWYCTELLLELRTRCSNQIHEPLAAPDLPSDDQSKSCVKGATYFRLQLLLLLLHMP
jgi:hypothetical protein